MKQELALLGGEPLFAPAMQWTWPPRYAGMGDLVKRYVDQGEPLSIQGDNGIYQDCEQQIEQRFKRRHALLCSSGTMALYSAFFALGIKPGDEIICPTITYHASATPAMHLGAHIVLVDVEPDTGNISVDAAAAAISPRTVALVTNAMWGHPVEQAALRQLCDQHHLAWIEDISHAHFACYENRPVGSFGDIACASLQGTKFVSGGEGGVLLTNQDDLYLRAVLLGHNLKRSVTLSKNTPYEPIGRTGYGLKLRMHPLAALLIHDQIVHHADQWLEERTRSLNILSSSLSQLPGITPPVIKPYVSSMGAWYGYKPTVDTGQIEIRLETLVSALQAEGLDVDMPGSPPLHTLPLFDSDRFPIGLFSKYNNQPRLFPGTDQYLNGRLSLPTPTGQRDEAILTGLIQGFEKVWSHLDSLRCHEN